MAKRWYQRTGDEGLDERPLRVPWLILVVLPLLVLLITHPLWLPLLARLLVVNQPPGQADAIVVLGGGNGSRQDAAIALYDAGLAPLVVSSGEMPFLPGVQPSFARIAADYMIARGVPGEDIVLLEETTSTYEEAQNCLLLAQEMKLASLIVVTDNYHTRRTCLTFRHVFRRSDIRLTFVAAQPDWFDVRSWWTQERSLLAFMEEYEKLGFYLLRGYLF